MTAPLIHLNGPPGVGKLTIGRCLAPLIDARLLDNHAIYDVAFAITEFRSPEFYATVRDVRNIAYDRILASPPTIRVILTGAYFEDSDWGCESWRALLELAERRKASLFAVQLVCDPTENRRRIAMPGRNEKDKLRDPARVDDWADRRMRRQGAKESLQLDVTELTADDAAHGIAQWLGSVSSSFP